ncbi:hypothetical protein K1719_039399 [Acacia pycnantha]|nr:hypothetical protein K1719_039399 [Acacia pycnantha]
MKILLLNMLLVAFAVVHAQDDAQAPPLPPGVADPVEPPPMSCKEQCALKCSEKHGFGRMLCMGKCKVLCKIISPSDHAGYQCTRDCVLNNLNHQPGIKNIDDLVNTCHKNCSKNV